SRHHLDYGRRQVLSKLLRLSQQCRKGLLRGHALSDLQRLSWGNARLRCPNRDQLARVVRSDHRPRPRFRLVRQHQRRDWGHLRMELQASCRVHGSARVVKPAKQMCVRDRSVQRAGVAHDDKNAAACPISVKVMTELTESWQDRIIYMRSAEDLILWGVQRPDPCLHRIYDSVLP